MNSLILRWNPYSVFTATTKEIRQWFDHFGAFAFYNGIAWQPRIKRLGAGINEVRFVEYK